MKWLCDDCGNTLTKEEGVWALWGRDSAWYTICSKCEETRRETEPHTCSTCRFCNLYTRSSNTCVRISKGLNINVNGIKTAFPYIDVELDFSCGFWEYMPRYSWSDLSPFIYGDLADDAWVVFCKPGDPRVQFGPDWYTKKQASRMAKWLNSLWNEEKGEKDDGTG